MYVNIPDGLGIKFWSEVVLKITEKLMRTYFNHIYNPVYDFTTARLSRYLKLQQTCISKLDLKDNDSILCVGVGTGNELLHLIHKNRNVSIVGIDYSQTALHKAYYKALKLGKKIKVLNMDARYLKFPPDTFNKVLCIHVMDFLPDSQQVTNEIFRVLKERGQFAITYPSDKEDIKMGSGLLKDAINNGFASGKNHVKVLLGLIPQMLISAVYLPQMVFRQKKNVYSRSELKTMLDSLTDGGFQIEEDPVYQDFTVSGRKSTKGGKSNAP